MVKLKIHTVPELNMLDVRVGEEYDVIDVDDSSLYVDIKGQTLSFTLEPDELGVSYKNWFDIVL